MKVNPNEFITPTSVTTNRGLTKREYFAAMAMQGILGNSGMNKVIGDAARRADQHSERFIAIFAAQSADALIAELNKAAE